MTNRRLAARALLAALLTPLCACSTETVLIPVSSSVSQSATTGTSSPSSPEASASGDPDTRAKMVSSMVGARVYFGHQSIGFSILRELNEIALEGGVGRLNHIDLAKGDTVPISGGFLANVKIGRNGHPLAKIKEFDAAMRAGLAQHLDVAILKFCYLDVRESTNVEAVFNAYRKALDSLQSDFPNVAFIHATVPLQVADHANDNAARERLNRLIRKAYASGHVWDLASVESTRPDGKRVTSESKGRAYEALYPGYTDDGAHLNETGARLAAEAMLRSITDAL